jgi:proteic killer suppression protein
MILSFRHRGLERFFFTGSRSGINPEQAQRLRLMLGCLAAATSARDMALPGMRLPRLKGELRDRWSVTVSGNWRVTFAFRGKDVVEVDYEDYH